MASFDGIVQLRAHLFVRVVLCLVCIAPGLWLRNPAWGLLGGAIAAFLIGVDPVYRSAFYSKQSLQIAIVILGLTLDLNDLVSLSADFSWAVAAYVLLTIVMGLALARLCGVDQLSGRLLTFGTAICGGTTIATVAPLMRAPPGTVAVAMAGVFILNFVAVMVFPYVAHQMGLSQLEFGAFSALAVHDTSSVVATAAQYGDEAAQVAATVKLGRTLWLIPLVVAVGAWMSRAHNDGAKSARLQIPGFVLAFVAASVAGTFLPLPDNVMNAAGMLSKWLLVVALFLVGVQINRETLRGLKGRTGVFAAGLWLLVIPLAFGLVMLITQ